ncbi:MAG: hypothetical protein WCP28_12465 [Actinomycetes bacterium]
MNQLRAVVPEIPRASVVSFGEVARAVAVGVADRYPTCGHVATDADPAAVVADVLAALEPRQGSASEQGCLPAVLLVAGTESAAEVLGVMTAIRDAQPAMKPRVWPAFVSGDVEGLGTFDQQLDQAGPGLCDIVLVLMGAPSAADQADALGAWLHVKMPAPASVLGELPDSQGRICRYVAVGSTGIEIPEADSAIPADLPAPDAEAITHDVRGELPEAVWTLSIVICAQQALAALREAGAAADPAIILRRENVFANALAAVADDLPNTLRQYVAGRVGDLLGASPVVIDLRNTTALGDLEGLPSLPPTPPAPTLADRSEQVSALVLLASKGGLGKLFGKGKIALASEALAAACQLDLEAVVGASVSVVNSQVSHLVAAAVGVQRRSHQIAVQRAATERGGRRRAAWDFSIEKARSRATIWTPIETAGITRAWGGQVPAPRRYLVGSADVVKHATDRDDSMTVIDLRGPLASDSGAGEPGEKVQSAQTDPLPGVESRAVVLVAQYGLPLAALR